MMTAVVLSVASPIALVVALAVLFAGRARIVNLIDYARVPDPSSLHRALGLRLLALPAGFAILAGLAWTIPDLALVTVAASVLVPLLVIA
jgi:hypothetical protein